ncbi:hypothetical protein I317_01271 [Kwoniella heveanensis CBS 569]|nr:hypothetical protein I317_01271 [Kwoniella heveanensis CBS 569]
MSKTATVEDSAGGRFRTTVSMEAQPNAVSVHTRDRFSSANCPIHAPSSTFTATSPSIPSLDLDLQANASASNHRQPSARRPRSVSVPPSIPPFAFERFPEDITAHLVSTIGLVSCHNTLLNLCRCSKGMYDIFSPYLYRDLTLTSWNVRKIFSGLLWDIQAAISSPPEYHDPTNGAVQDCEESRYRAAKAREDELWEGLCWVKWCFGPKEMDDPPFPMSEEERRRRFPLDEGDRDSQDNASMFDWRLSKSERRARDPLRWSTREERLHEQLDHMMNAQSHYYAASRMTAYPNGRMEVPCDPQVSHRRKLGLLNLVHHLTINDLEAATTLASYLDIAPIPIPDYLRNHPCRHSHPPRRIFLALKSITLGSNLLRTEFVDDEDREQLSRHMSSSRNAFNQIQTIHALACGLRPSSGIACARWESTNSIKVRSRDYIWLSNLEALFRRWEICTFTWHVDLDDDRLPRASMGTGMGGWVAQRSEEVDLSLIAGEDSAQWSFMGCLKTITHLRVFYHGVCSCELGCSNDHLTSGASCSASTPVLGMSLGETTSSGGGGGGSNDACLAELGRAAFAIDQMRWGDPLPGSSFKDPNSTWPPAYTNYPLPLRSDPDSLGPGVTESEERGGGEVQQRSVELIGLPCLIGIPGTPGAPVTHFERVKVAAIGTMRRAGFGKIEIRAAEKRWDSRREWVEKQFRLVGNLGSAEQCNGCGCR